MLAQYLPLSSSGFKNTSFTFMVDKDLLKVYRDSFVGDKDFTTVTIILPYPSGQFNARSPRKA